MDQQMTAILSEIAELNQEYPDGLVAIGGVAVFLHATASGELTPETTHDIDFFLSLENLGALRDRDDITRNANLNKHQIVRRGIEMDVYVERQNSLAISYEDVERHSEMLSGIRTAAKEHLLALKIDAAIDRRGSGKGAKDEKDLVNLLLMLDSPREPLLRPTMDAERMNFLRSLVRRSEPFQEVAGGNAHRAAALRKKATTNLAKIEGAIAIRPLNGHPAQAGRKRDRTDGRDKR